MRQSTQRRHGVLPEMWRARWFIGSTANPIAAPPAVGQPPATPATPAAATIRRRRLRQSSADCRHHRSPLCSSWDRGRRLRRLSRQEKSRRNKTERLSRNSTSPKADSDRRRHLIAPSRASHRKKQFANADGQKGAGLLDQIFADNRPLPMYVDDVPDSFIVGNSLATSCPDYSGSLPSQGPPTELIRQRFRLNPGCRSSTRGAVSTGTSKASSRSIPSRKINYVPSIEHGIRQHDHRRYKNEHDADHCRNDLDTAHLYITEHRRDYPDDFSRFDDDHHADRLIPPSEIDGKNSLGIQGVHRNEIARDLFPINGAEI